MLNENNVNLLGRKTSFDTFIHNTSPLPVVYFNLELKFLTIMCINREMLYF